MIRGFCENNGCGKFIILHKSKKDGKLVCVTCHNKDPFYHKICSGCKLLKKIVMRTFQKIYDKVCPKCGKKSPVQDKTCQWCLSEKSSAEAVIKYFCRSCYNKHDYRKEVCSVCGRKRSAHGRDELDRPICGSCYNSLEENHKICSKCGNSRRIAARTRSGKIVCVTCWQRNNRAIKKVKPA